MNAILNFSLLGNLLDFHCVPVAKNMYVAPTTVPLVYIFNKYFFKKTFNVQSNRDFHRRKMFTSCLYFGG